MWSNMTSELKGMINTPWLNLHSYWQGYKDGPPGFSHDFDNY